MRTYAAKKERDFERLRESDRETPRCDRKIYGKLGEFRMPACLLLPARGGRFAGVSRPSACSGSAKSNNYGCSVRAEGIWAAKSVYGVRLGRGERVD